MANFDTLFDFSNILNQIITDKIEEYVNAQPLIQVVTAVGGCSDQLQLRVKTLLGNNNTFIGTVIYPQGACFPIVDGMPLLSIPSIYFQKYVKLQNLNPILKRYALPGNEANCYLIPMTERLEDTDSLGFYLNKSKIQILKDESINIQKNNTKITIDTAGKVSITAGSSNISIDNSGKISLNSTQPVQVSLDVKTSAGVSLATHTHTSSAPGTPTSPPIPTP